MHECKFVFELGYQINRKDSYLGPWQKITSFANGGRKQTSSKVSKRRLSICTVMNPHEWQTRLDFSYRLHILSISDFTVLNLDEIETKLAPSSA